MPKNKSISSGLKEVIQDSIVDLWDTCSKLLHHIYSLPEKQQETAFKTLLRDIDISDYTMQQSPEELTTIIKQENIASIFPITSKILQNLFNSDCNEEVFYQRLWASLNNKELFPELEDQIAVLLLLWSDSRLPYTNLGKGLTMEEDEFRDCVGTLEDELSKMRRIVNSNLQQRTQTASLIMDIAKNIPDEKNITVFWAITLAYYADHEIERRERKKSPKV